MTEPSDGVWEFHGNITVAEKNDATIPIEGLYYPYPNGSFDLVVLGGEERITVMPSNALLRERGLQGVVMRGGEPVSTGQPITATCQDSISEGQ